MPASRRAAALICRASLQRIALAAAALPFSALAAGCCAGEMVPTRQKVDRVGKPIESPAAVALVSSAQSKRGAEHPLAPALRMAEDLYTQIDENVRDYTATLVKRERIGGKLAEPQAMFTKIRHQQVKDGKVVVPFSVYMNFVLPERIQGREVLYVAGRNDGDLLAQESPKTWTGTLWGTTALDPKGMLAMRGNRYPITEVGMKNLIRRLIEVAREDMKYGECSVTIREGAKVDGRICRCLQVVHPVRREEFRFHLARVFVDDELNLPIRYASYDWPERKGAEPPLIEEYSYLKLKTNVGLTDRDFDQANPEYHFR